MTPSTVLLWMADNYALWQPFGLLLAVGSLILALPGTPSAPRWRPTMPDPTITAAISCPRCGTDISARAAIRKAVAAERERIAGGLRALHERLSNDAKPKRKFCDCGLEMASHAGGWVLLNHDFFIVDRLADAIIEGETP